MKALDTNVLVRLLVADDDDQTERAAACIERRCTAQSPCWLNRIVLRELAWVLDRAYGYSRSRIGPLRRIQALRSTTALRATVVGVAAAFLCQSCTQQPAVVPGPEHNNFHEYMAAFALDAFDRGDRPDIPSSIWERMADCVAEWSVAQYTPTQLQALDAAARGEREFPPELVDHLARRLKAMGTPTLGNSRLLREYCPEHIPAFQKYVRY